MKKLVISTLFVMQAVIAMAQTGISGKVVDSRSQKPLQNVVVTVTNTTLTQTTDILGMFKFDVEAGNQSLQFRSVGYKDLLLAVQAENGKTVDLGVVVMEVDMTSEQELSLVTITENDLGDDNSGSESTS